MSKTIASCVIVILNFVCVPAIDALICVSTPGELRYVRGIVLVKTEGAAPLLPGATVSLIRGKFRATVIADEDGYFSFRSVGEGEFVLQASLEGYASTSVPITVRARALVSRVLVVALSDDLESGCAGVEFVEWKKARDLQDAAKRVKPESARPKLQTPRAQP